MNYKKQLDKLFKLIGLFHNTCMIITVNDYLKKDITEKIKLFNKEKIKYAINEM